MTKHLLKHVRAAVPVAEALRHAGWGIAAFALMLGVLAGPSAVAQDDPPISHEVSFPTGDTAWKVRLTHLKKGAIHREQDSAAEEEPATEEPVDGTKAEKIGIRLIDVVRKGSLRRDQVRWTDGSTTEYWWPAGSPVVVFKTHQDKDVRVMRRSIMDTRAFDESLFHFVSAATFRKAQSFRGKKCLAYDYEKPMADGETMTIYAWINAKTHQPWAWSDGANLVLFNFNVPIPAEPLIIPPEFASALRTHEAYYAPPKRLGAR